MIKNEFSQRRRKFSHFLGLNIGEILYFALFRGIFPNICSWEGSKIKISQNKLCHVFLYTKWHLKTLGNFWFSKKVHLSTPPNLGKKTALAPKSCPKNLKIEIFSCLVWDISCLVVGKLILPNFYHITQIGKEKLKFSLLRSIFGQYLT